MTLSTLNQIGNRYAERMPIKMALISNGFPRNKKQAMVNLEGGHPTDRFGKLSVRKALILGDPGAVSGAEDKVKTGGKKFGEQKYERTFLLLGLRGSTVLGLLLGLRGWKAL